MNRFACILLATLRGVVQYRAALFPAAVGFISAVAAALGRKIDIGRIQQLVDATGLLATVLSSVIGAIMDATNAQVRNAVDDHASQLKELNPGSNPATLTPLPPSQESKP